MTETVPAGQGVEYISSCNLKSSNFPRLSKPTQSTVTLDKTSAATSGQRLSKFRKTAENAASGPTALVQILVARLSSWPNNLLGFLRSFATAHIFSPIELKISTLIHVGPDKCLLQSKLGWAAPSPQAILVIFATFCLILHRPTHTYSIIPRQNLCKELVMGHTWAHCPL